MRELAAVTSIVARCLTEPEFLSRIAAEPLNALADYPLSDRTRRDFLSLDVHRLTRFGGLIAKVQHNYLWEGFAGTLLLLKHFRIELSVFAEYRRAIAGQIRPETREQRTAALLDFLSAYIAHHGRRRWSPLRTVLTHERHLWSVANQLAAWVDPASTPQPAAPVNGRFPHFTGPVHLAEYTCNPVALIEQARGRRSRRLRSRGRHRFVYVGRPRTKSVEVLTVDRDVFRVLRFIDGRRSTAQLCASAGKGGQLTSRRCLLLLSRARALDIIDYSRERSESAQTSTTGSTGECPRGYNEGQ